MSSMKLLCRYQYDPLDRLTGLKPLERSDTQRFYQGNDLVNEIEGQEQLTIMRNEAQPLAQRHSVGDVAKTTLLATDQQHSVLQTRTATDTQHLAYTAYGHHPVESGLSNLLGFNGERPDSVTGHYLLGQGKRAFNPVLMRFNSPDALSPFGDGGINPYVYCGNDPINRYDPSGNIPSIVKPWNWIKTHRPWETLNGLDLSSRVISRTTSQSPQRVMPSPSRQLLQQPSSSNPAGASSTSALSPAVPEKIPFEKSPILWRRKMTDTAGELKETTKLQRNLADRAYTYDDLARKNEIPKIVEDPILRETFDAAQTHYEVFKPYKNLFLDRYNNAAANYQRTRRNLKSANLALIEEIRGKN